MSPFQKILRDPAFWALVILNLMLIYYYDGTNGQYTTIVWIYWCQSVLLGVFNFFDMLTLKNAVVGDMTYNNRPVTIRQAKGCLPVFFVFHYGLFHIAYMVFLYAEFGFSGMDYTMLKWAMGAIFINQLILFLQNKTLYADLPRNIGTMFIIPYLRIVPMHLTILLPEFLHWEPMLTFLILKTILDIGAHLATTKYYWSKETRTEGGFI